MNKFENIYQDAALMRKFLLGEANEAERKELEKRLAECPDLKKVYEQLQNGETLKAAFGEYKDYSSKKAYQSFLQKIGRMEKKERKPFISRVWWYAAAAVIVLAVGLSFYMSNFYSAVEEKRALIQPGTQQAQLTLPDGSIIDVDKKEVNVVVDGVQVKYKKGVLSYQPTVTTQHEEESTEEKPVKSNELVIPRGGENTVILADGTTVHLNAGSKLTYPVRFAGKRRVVALEGEAYFEVCKTGQPFIVCTQGMQVEVLGTTFNISAYPQEEYQTTLVNGSVKVNTETGESCILKPSQQATISLGNSSIQIRMVDAGFYTSWIKGKIHFKDQRLEDIMKILSRWYDMEVIFANEKIKDLRFGCNVDRYSEITPFVRLLEETQKVHVKVNNKTITFYN